jgi:hypothetical protein
MSENKNAKTPADGGSGFIDGVWYWPGPTAWQCQCGKAYTVTCISSKPQKKEWVGLTDEEMDELVNRFARYGLAREIESKLKEKNGG